MLDKHSTTQLYPKPCIVFYAILQEGLGTNLNVNFQTMMALKPTLKNMCWWHHFPLAFDFSVDRNTAVTRHQY